MPRFGKCSPAAVGSTEGHGLPTREEILSAVRWRLDSWGPQDLEKGATLAAGIPAHSVRDDTPAVARALACLPTERRTPWSALCALLALRGETEEDPFLLALAGSEVVGAYRQAMRGRARRSRGALARMIAEFKRNCPGGSADEHFDILAGLGSMAHDVIADYDAAGDALWYEPRLGAALRRVSRESFRRQFSRVDATRPD